MAQQGMFYLFADCWLLVGTLPANRPHRHVSASLLWGLDKPFDLQIDGQWHRQEAALVAPDVHQALDPRDGRMLVVQLEPDAAPWLSLAATGLDWQWRPITPPDELRRLLLDLPATSDCIQARECLRTLAALLVDNGQSNNVPQHAHPMQIHSGQIDPRIVSVADNLRTQLPEKLDITQLAASVGLSGSRLRHLFRERTGTTLKRFLLHLKLRAALASWQPGMSLSALAVEAGFYDQPHLVRTAREMFDALPSLYISEGNFRINRCQGRFSW